MPCRPMLTAQGACQQRLCAATSVDAPPSSPAEIAREVEDAPMDQLRLICVGRQLERGRTLADYSIHTESVINVFLRLRGD